MTGSTVQRAVAGAGKTYWLVGQYVDLVVDADPPLDPNGVVVITFTEAAARELVDRVRGRLTEIVREDAGSRSARAQVVLDGLGSAPIGTIHAFARRLLLQNAPAVGVPFGVEVVDHLEPTVLTSMAKRIQDHITIEAERRGIAGSDLQRSGTWRPTYLSSDATGLLEFVSGALLRAPEWASVAPERLTALEQDAWDGLAAAFDRPDDVLTRASATQLLDLLASAFATVTAAAGLTVTFQDKLDLLAYLRDRVGVGESEDAVDSALKKGNNALLTKPMRAHCEKVGLTAVLAAVDTIHAHNVAVVEWQARQAAAYARLAGALAVEAFVWGRSQGGTDWVLQDELLQKCLVLMLSDEATRLALQQRYPRVLLDEAQDVDATQRDLLLLLAGSAGMTVVGDPQQSIYGFRGADHATFADLTERLLGGGEPEALDTTRRSLPIIVDAVNAVFAQDAHHTQMSAHRDGAQGSVTALRAVPVKAPDPTNPDKERTPNATEYRRVQAAAIADEVVRFLSDDNLPIWDQVAACWRPAKPADLAILVPSRTPVPDLERALHARQVPTTVRTSRDMARVPGAEGLAAAVLALLAPDDTKSLLLALRSPLFALTDAEVTSWVLANGRLRIPHGAQEAGDADDVEQASRVAATAAALDVLRRAREVLAARGPGRAAGFLAAEQGLAATLIAADGTGWVEGWSQVRLLIDTLTDRYASVVEPGTATAQWLRDQLAMAGKTNLSVLHEPDAAGVTITTVHQAKGLQWPIVVVAALTRDEAGTASLALGDGDVFTHLTKDFSHQPDGPAPAAPPPEQARLMYVAMTRAQDHLVVSGIGQPARGGPPVLDGTYIAGCLESLADARVRVVDVPVIAGYAPSPEPVGLGRVAGEWSGPGDVVARLAAVADSARKTIAKRSPSGAAHATSGDSRSGRPRPVDAAAAPAASGRRAVAPGRAAAVGDYVHGVLERVDLAVFCDPLAAFDMAVAGVLPAVDELTDDERAHAWRTLKHARGSTVLARAAAAPVCRRELPISGHTEGDGVLTVTVGSIDMLIGEDHAVVGGAGGRRWVLVDYKTDATGRAVDDFIAMHAPQLAVYEGLLADCGIRVAEKWLVRLGGDGAEDVRVP